MTLRGLLTALILSFGFAAAAELSSDVAPFPAPAGVTAAESQPVIDFARPEAVLDLGVLPLERASQDGGTFTLSIRNNAALPVARVLRAADFPGAGLAAVPS